MAKRITRALVIIVPVLILVVYLLRERSPFGGKNSSFAIDQGYEITRIEIASDTNKLTLLKDGDLWFVNRKKEARKSSISFITRILTGLEIKSPVSSELFNDQITGKGVKPVKVRVFQGRKLLKSFLVFRTGSNVYGNIMKLRERSKPFIVYVPGTETEIGSAFNTNELFWQPFTIFELQPSQISAVTVENLKDQGSSFMIRISKDGYILTDLQNDLSGWDTSRIERYLSYFTHIPFETWAFDISAGEREVIKSGKPLYRISVDRKSGGKIVLNLWERKLKEDGNEKVDSDRLWADTGAEKVLFIVRYLDIDPVLKKRSYFYPD